jgi:plastocyanin
MIWLWRICFSAAFAGLLSGAAVSGSVGLRDSRNPNVARKQDYSGVVIWLEPVSNTVPVRLAPHHARMVQKNKTFAPHVLAIPVGTVVDFPNFDPIFHNAFSNYNGQIFDVGLYPPGTSRAVRFSRPGIVRVFCNIHAGMSAVIAVLNTPWFTVTGSDGKFVIPNVPDGDYSLHVFHERATSATLDSLTERIAVSDSPLVLHAINISESGYLTIPHKNKYGHDYPPAPENSYPAVRE